MFIFFFVNFWDCAYVYMKYLWWGIFLHIIQNERTMFFRVKFVSFLWLPVGHNTVCSSQAYRYSDFTHMRERDWHDIVNQLYLKKKKKSKNKQKNFKGAESQGRIEYHYFTHQRVAPLGSSFRYLPPRFFFPRPNNPLTRSSQENSFCKHDLNLSCSQFRKALLPSGHWQYLEPSGVVTCGECCWHSVHRGRGCC